MHRILNVLFCLFITWAPFALVAESLASCQTQPLALGRTWSDGIVTDGIGPAGIVVADLNADGQQEILTATAYAPLVLRKTDGGYAPLWIGPSIKPKKVAQGDLDGDGIPEIVVGTDDGRIAVFRGDNFSPVASFIVTPATGTPSAISGLAVAKVTSSEANEIVAATQGSTFVFDGPTLALEWEAAGKGGSQLAIGDLEGDGSLEILVDGPTAHVLDAIHKTEKWGYAGGFGPSTDVGDVDGDGKAEILYVVNWSGVSVLDGDTLAPKWTLSTFDPSVVKAGDIDGDGVAEVILGDGQWGSVHAFKGTDGTEIGMVPNPEHGVSGIGVGDCDGDGTAEVLWGAGLSSSGRDALLVGDLLAGVVKWNAPDLDGPFYVAAGDLDGDGTQDIVASAASTDSTYAGGTVRVYNGRTHALEWTTTPAQSFDTITQVAVGQLDSDPALEVLVGTNSWYNTVFTSYDGLTHEKEWSSGNIGQNGPIKFTVKDVEGDGRDEIIAALTDQRVYVFAGASNLIKWQSAPLEGYIKDLALGDADGDGVLDLAVLTDSNLYLFRTGAWTQTVKKSLGGGDRVTILSLGSGTAGEILYSHYNSSWSGKVLSALDGITYGPLWDYSLGAATVSEISAQDLDRDGNLEVVVVGGNQDYFYYNPTSFFLVGTAGGGSPFCPRWQGGSIWGSMGNCVAGDFNGDGYGEASVGTATGIQIWDTAPHPAACLLNPSASASPLSGVRPLEVAFSYSLGEDSCSWIPTMSWDFGDGATSTDQNPTHTYYQAGTYQWALSASGYEETVRRDGTIEVTDPPCSMNCSAYITPLQGIPPLTVTYSAYISSNNCSGDVTYHWDFGDGSSSDTNYGSHTYSDSGSYTATMTAAIGGVTCVKTLNVQAFSLDCSLTCSAVSSHDSGQAPLSVSFASSVQQYNCLGQPLYAWDFGDGETSSVAAPGHTYAEPGLYRWSLKVTSADQECLKGGTITVLSPCIVECSATSPEAATVGSPVPFAASATATNCTGAPVYDWDFGDGSAHSQSQGPLHVYSAPGSYTWVLKVALGDSSCSRSGVISVLQPCTVACTATVPLSGSAGTPLAFVGTTTPSNCSSGPICDWDFGDGSPHSSQLSPTHLYSSPGTYLWTLTVTAGADVRCTKSGTLAIVAPPQVVTVKKTSPPFALAVTGANLQSGIQVHINGAPWTNVVWKGTSKVVITGGASLKAVVPKGVSTTLTFTNPDGGQATTTFTY